MGDDTFKAFLGEKDWAKYKRSVRRAFVEDSAMVGVMSAISRSNVFATTTTAAAAAAITTTRTRPIFPHRSSGVLLPVVR